jgi:hypothetical protein
MSRRIQRDTHDSRLFHSMSLRKPSRRAHLAALPTKDTVCHCISEDAMHGIFLDARHAASKATVLGIVVHCPKAPIAPEALVRAPRPGRKRAMLAICTSAARGCVPILVVEQTCAQVGHCG